MEGGRGRIVGMGRGIDVYIFILFIYTKPIILFQTGNVGEGGNANLLVVQGGAVMNGVVPGIIIYILRHYFMYLCVCVCMYVCICSVCVCVCVCVGLCVCIFIYFCLTQLICLCLCI